MFCVSCGAENFETYKNCTRCGAELFLGKSGLKELQHKAVEPVTDEHSPAISSHHTSPVNRGISTKQMIVLWYGVLGTITIIITSGSTLGITVAVLVLTGTTIYTLSPHPNVRRKQIVLWVVGPTVAVCGVGAGLFLYQSKPSYHLSAIPGGSVELFDTKMSLSSYCGEITGRLRNHSSMHVKSVKLHITLSDTTGAIDGGDSEANVDVPASETRSFNSSICGLRETPGWTWSYSIVEIRGE